MTKGGSDHNPLNPMINTTASRKPLDHKAIK